MHNSRRDFFRLAIAAPLAGAVAAMAPQTEERAELEPYEYGRHERPLKEAQADCSSVGRPVISKRQAEARARWAAMAWDEPYVSKAPPMPRAQVRAELEAIGWWEGNSDA